MSDIYENAPLDVGYTNHHNYHHCVLVAKSLTYCPTLPIRKLHSIVGCCAQRKWKRFEPGFRLWAREVGEEQALKEARWGGTSLWSQEHPRCGQGTAVGPVPLERKD